MSNAFPVEIVWLIALLKIIYLDTIITYVIYARLVTIIAYSFFISVSNLATRERFKVSPRFIGHGIGRYFHGPPDILHFGTYHGLNSNFVALL